MVATPEQLDELETFFASLSLPQRIKLNAGVTVLDLPEFIRKNLERLKSGDMTDAAARPRYDDLLRLRELLQEQK